MTKPLSGRAIQREVLADALQHPVTLFPFAAGCLAGIYGVFFSPFFGGTLPALAVGLGAAAIGVASFGWHYFVHGERYAREKAGKQVAEETAQRGLENHLELARLRRDLEEGFKTQSSTAGLQALNRLTDEWRQVRDALARPADDDIFTSDDITRAVHETYRHGLDTLADALKLVQAIAATDRPSLQADLNELEGELRLSENGAGAERRDVKQDLAASHQRRLDLLAHQERQIETLLQEAALTEGALEHARLALPTLSMDHSERGAAEVAETLHRVVDRAQRVQQRLQTAAFPDEETPGRQEKNEGVR